MIRNTSAHQSTGPTHYYCHKAVAEQQQLSIRLVRCAIFFCCFNASRPLPMPATFRSRCPGGRSLPLTLRRRPAHCLLLALLACCCCVSASLLRQLASDATDVKLRVTFASESEAERASAPAAAFGSEFRLDPRLGLYRWRGLPVLWLYWSGPMPDLLRLSLATIHCNCARDMRLLLVNDSTAAALFGRELHPAFSDLSPNHRADYFRFKVLEVRTCVVSVLYSPCKS